MSSPLFCMSDFYSALSVASDNSLILLESSLILLYDVYRCLYCLWTCEYCGKHIQPFFGKCFRQDSCFSKFCGRKFRPQIFKLKLAKLKHIILREFIRVIFYRIVDSFCLNAINHCNIPDWRSTEHQTDPPNQHYCLRWCQKSRPTQSPWTVARRCSPRIGMVLRCWFESLYPNDSFIIFNAFFPWAVVHFWSCTFHKIFYRRNT